MDGPSVAPEQDAGERKLRFRLIKFQDMRPGLEPAYLVDGPIISSATSTTSHVYFEGELGWRAAADRVTRDSARRIAANIAKLPASLRRSRGRADFLQSREVD